MNLNEVEKHVKFDLILNLLIYIAIGLCLFLSLIIILSTPAKAETFSTDLTNYGIAAGQECLNHPNNAFCSSEMVQGSSSNACGNGDAKCLLYMAYGTDNNVYSLNFKVNTSFRANANSTINLKSNYFANVTYGCTTNVGTLNNTGCKVIRNSSTSININFSTNANPLTYPEFSIYVVSGNGINPNRSFNVNSITLYETPRQNDSSNSDTFDDSGIINNANQNTSEIIQNQDNNAHETQNVIIAMNDRIMQTLSNLCKNFFNYKVDVSQIHYYNILANYSVTDNSVSMTSNGNWSYIIFPISVSRNTTYYVKYSRTNSVNNDTIFQIKDNYGNNNDGVIATRYDGGLNASYSMTFNSGNNTTLYVRLYVSTGYSGNTVTFNNIMISPVDEPYCVYGSFTNKLDDIGGVLGGLSDKADDTNSNLEDVKDLQQEQNDYLMDDTNPSIPTSDIDNVMDSVEVSDPLNYLLVLPINLLHKLNQVLSSNSCQRVSFGSLYETEIYLPCINFEQILGSNIWNTIDLIVGVGLLAIILKRFYDSISNVLTLGKEKEVRDKLDLPTPMQFMASILGGGRD